MGTFRQRTKRRPRSPSSRGLVTRRNPEFPAIFAASGGSSDDCFSGGSIDIEAFCDQCGDVIEAVAGSELVLAVCRAPGCGVEFSQCDRCGREYSGCCSMACQEAAATAAAAAPAQPKTPGGGRGLGPGSRVGGGCGGMNGVGKEAGGAAGGRVTRGRGDPDVVALNGISLQGRGVNGDAIKGEAQLSAGVSAGAVTAVAKGKGGLGRPEREDNEEPALESYASRHSEPESSLLVEIREATVR